MNERALSIGLSAGVFVVGALLAANLGTHTRSEPVAAAAAVSICERSISFGPSCGSCIAASCCAALDACYASTECIDLNDCTVKCGEEEEERGDHRVDGAEACPKECAEKHPHAVGVFRAWDECATAHCGTVCPPRR